MKPKVQKSLRLKTNMQTCMIGLAALSFLLLLLYPKAREIYASKHRLVEIKNKITTANAAIQSLPALYKDTSKVNQLLEQERKAFIAADKVSSVLLSIDQAVADSGVYLENVTPEIARLSVPYTFGRDFQFQLFPVQLTLRGSYPNITRFYDKIFKSGKFLLLDRARIENNTRDPENLQAVCTLQYFLDYQNKDKKHAEIE